MNVLTSSIPGATKGGKKWGAAALQMPAQTAVAPVRGGTLLPWLWIRLEFGTTVIWLSPQILFYIGPCSDFHRRVMNSQSSPTRRLRPTKPGCTAIYTGRLGTESH